jgi:hypothetical protein
LDLGADIFIGAAPPPDTLRAAVAHAFDVPVDRVAIHRAETAWPVADVVLEYIDDAPVPGDYPLQLLPWVPADRTDDPGTLTMLAVALGAPVLTSSDSYDPMDMELYLPDGSMHYVSVDQDEDGGIRNTLEMRRLIDAGPQSTRRAVAS